MTKEDSFMTNRELIREIYQTTKDLKDDMILVKEGLSSNQIDITALKKANSKWLERGLAGGIAIVVSSLTNFFTGK